MLFDLIGIQFYNNAPCDGTPANVDASYKSNWAPLYVLTLAPKLRIVHNRTAAFASHECNCAEVQRTPSSICSH